MCEECFSMTEQSFDEAMIEKRYHCLMEIGTMSLWFLHFCFFPTHSFISIAHNQFILLRQKVIPLQYDEFHKDTEENLPKGNWFCLTKIVHHYIDFETFNHFPEW